MTTENAKVMCIPTMNGLLIKFGKKVCPDRYAAWLAERVWSDGPSSVVIGLYPRNAAKSDPTGGRFATWCATVVDTPDRKSVV